MEYVIKGGYSMRSPMDQKTFLEFYKNTILGSSNSILNYICALLEKENKITFEAQCKLGDSNDTIYYSSKRDFKKIITETTTNIKFVGFYEYWEYIKLYKYSVPLFYEESENESIENCLLESGIKEFDLNNYDPELVLNTSLKEATPMYWKQNGDIFVKFVLQKSYVLPDTFDQIDYRYPIVIYINKENHILEVRYDAIKYNNNVFSNGAYENILFECINWLQNNLHLRLYLCEHKNILPIINDKQNEDVKIYKQLMQMDTGASAELTASESTDYVLPFIGELKELIDENEELFDQAEDIKKILLQYLDDKEATASYPYIYIKWVKPVESQSYIVKIIFEYFSQKYTLLQHITGNCKDLGMERMNDAIKYLCKSGAFSKGNEIKP